MTIAVTYENGQVFQHFGHSEFFKLYEVEDGRVAASRVIDTNGSGHGALALLLSGQKVDILICGGIGPGAQNALAQAGIKLCAGVSGSADGAVDAYLAGTLAYGAAANCGHHGEHHHGQCREGGHDCGHSCP